MTIAAGFYCNEGIILCADSQMTVSGYIKNYDGKIRTVMTKNLVAAFVGSGTTDYIETAIQKASECLSECKSIHEVRGKLEENLLEFFDKHLAPWAFFPENERPTVELLIAVSTKLGPCDLFHYCGTSLHRTDSKAIGAGILLANSLISEYFWNVTTLDRSAPLAVFILSKVKEQIDSCGGFTDMLLLRKGADVAFTDSSEIEQLENELSAIEKGLTENLKAGITSARLPHKWMSDHVRRKASGG